MDVGAPFVAHGQPPHAMQPRSGAFHLPAVLAQLLAGVDASPREAWPDVALAQSLANEAVVVLLVGMQLVGRRRGLPRAASTGTMLSSSAKACWLSWRLAAVRDWARGKPWPSTTR